jgi:hypothetical protein
MHKRRSLSGITLLSGKFVLCRDQKATVCYAEASGVGYPGPAREVRARETPIRRPGLEGEHPHCRACSEGGESVQVAVRLATRPADTPSGEPA